LESDFNQYAALLVNPRGRVIYANATLCEHTGFSLREITGMPLCTLLNEERPFAEWIRESVSSSCAKAETAVVTRMQHRLSSRISIIKVVLKGRRKHVYLIFFHNLQRGHRLTLLQQFAGTFLNDVNLGVILINNDFILVDISDTACSILGVVKEQVINKPLEEVFALVPKEHQLVERAILDGLIVRNYAVSWTNNHQRYELLMDSHLLKDERGNTVGAYVIFKDVSNLRSLEERVRKSDRLAMIGQIAAGTAHEIRNPLTSVKGFLQVLNKTLKEKGMTKETGYTEIMLQEIDRINGLISEILLLSKPTEGSLKPVNISTVLKEILPIINNEAILHGIIVQYEAAGDVPHVVADKELLKQVFLNICKNGIEAMSENGTLMITEKIDRKGRNVCVDISDSGPGIPSFLIDKIFDPFFTTKGTGIGLGLSICQRIIHDVGGTIRVSSKGFGTTFTISIPYCEKVGGMAAAGR
jgi:nitrogen-specific signal transduction histidine kinase